MKTKIVLPKGEYFDDLRRDLRDEASRQIFELELSRLRIAAQIAETRKKKRFTQGQLAKAIGMEQSSIARLESGRINVTVDTLGRIGMALGKKFEVHYA